MYSLILGFYRKVRSTCATWITPAKMEWNDTQKCGIMIAWRAGQRCQALFLFGVMPMTQKEFYRSRAWKRARQAYIDQRMAIDGGLCQVCGEEPGKIVHHTIWLDDHNCNDPSISLNLDLFLYECQTCHNKERDPRIATPGRCRYGPNGEILRNTNF